MDEATIYVWSGCDERTYARLQRGETSWRVDWGRRVPPGSSNFEHYTSLETDDRERAVRWLVMILRSIIRDPIEGECCIAKLKGCMASVPRE